MTGAAMSPTAQTAFIAGLFSLLGVLAATLLPLLTKNRASARRSWLETRQSETRETEASFVRLERENGRLTRELADYRTRVSSLETALQLEQGMHAATERRRVQCEDILRKLNRLPPPLDPDENGGAR